MNKLSKYQETAKRAIEVLKSDEFELNMSNYNSKFAIVEHGCGTTFCILGWLAFKDGYPSEFRNGISFNHDYYSHELIGNRSDSEWVFLFGSNWFNDKEKAIKRAEYVLAHDCCPNRREWSDYD